MDTERAYVNPEGNTVVLKCPHCGRTKTRQVGVFRGNKRRVKVRCPCQAVFHVSFEFRKTPRKEVRRDGYYIKLPKEGKWRAMLTTDISITDIGFTTLDTHDIKIGDPLKVRFTLGDDSRSRIEKQAIVRRIKDRHIGCEFIARLPTDVAARI